MKKGFTLIELLAVIVILAIIALIATPIILDIIGESKKNSDELSIEMYGRAIKNAIADYQVVNLGQIPKSIEDIKIENYYKGEKIECEITRINSYGEVYIDKCKKDGKEIEGTYGEYIDSSLAERPKLTEGLVPVKYENNKWIIADTTSEWYDYNKQEWANAVILSESGKGKKVGDTLKLPTSTNDATSSDVVAMFVWIPRYSYTISSTAGSNKSTPEAIDIKFVDKNTKENGSVTYTGDTALNYYTHPAFTFGEEELRGIWVGKFETSAKAGSNCYSNESEANCNNTTQEPYIIPNVPSLRYQSVNNHFETAKKFKSYINNSLDSHMMKNSEWGAVAYLSQSKYGKYGNNDYQGANKEVFKNDSSSYYTGRSLGRPSTASNEYSTNGTYLYDENINGTGASTTGNITGIYDMSGGAWDRVMGVYTQEGSSNTFNPLPDLKYYDNYITSSFATACNGGACTGHALGETSNWYLDYAGFVSVTDPWLFRGGYYGDMSNAGVFDSGNSGSGASSVWSFRIVLSKIN